MIGNEIMLWHDLCPFGQYQFFNKKFGKPRLVRWNVY